MERDRRCVTKCEEIVKRHRGPDDCSCRIIDSTSWVWGAPKLVVASVCANKDVQCAQRVKIRTSGDVGMLCHIIIVADGVRELLSVALILW